MPTTGSNAPVVSTFSGACDHVFSPDSTISWVDKRNVPDGLPQFVDHRGTLLAHMQAERSVELACVEEANQRWTVRGVASAAGHFPFKSKRHFVCSSIGATVAALSIFAIRYAVKRYWQRNGDNIKTRVLLATQQEERKESTSVRNSFNDLPMMVLPPLEGHTHGVAAADRSSASNFIDRLAGMIGRSAYFYQCSNADLRNDRQGSRTWHWSKDCTVQPSEFKLPENPLIAMVDVDHYIDMPTWLVDYHHPTILYTLQPHAVSRVASNYSYTFNSDNEVMYRVSGGGGFTHMVWNYSKDNLLLSLTFMGIPYRTVSYLVDRRQTSPDHELVMLTPTARWGWKGAFLARCWLTGGVLKRLNVVQERGFTRLMSSSLDGVKVSTGQVGSFASATVDAVVDDTIAITARCSDYKLTMPQVMSYVEGKREIAAPLLEFHRAKVLTKPDVVCPVKEAIHQYQFYPHLYDETAKPGMVAFMSPLIHGAYVPDQTVGNEKQAVQGRVTSVRPALLPLSPFLSKVMKEFATLLIPDDAKWQLDPVDDDEVMDRQSRPAQRRILGLAEASLPDRRTSSFVKKEPYANVKDPRMISTINGPDKREYSKFMYSFETVLKRQAWYAFGMTPVRIADRVVEVLARALMATNTDFSRFDGHGSNLMRELERIVILRAFRVQYHSALLELHRSQYNLKAYAKLGTKYETAFARLSGSPETSIFNTLVNAFVAFLALRKTKVDGLFHDAASAWLHLGVYGGDDGLTADVDPKVYESAASMIGQVLTVQPILRFGTGIKFLARVYSPEVWTGCVDSCCDLPRQLSKLHVTVQLPSNVSPQMKLLEKARSFILTDENTPIIGDFVKAVVKIHTSPIEQTEITAQIASWVSYFPKEVQYPNAAADWMMDYALNALPEFEYKRFLEWVGTANTYEKLLSPPMFQAPTQPETKVLVVVGAEVIPPPAVIPAAPVAPVVTEVKENKQAIEAKDQERKSADRVAKQARFEEWKRQKQAAGTWSDQPPPPRPGRGRGRGGALRR